MDPQQLILDSLPVDRSMEIGELHHQCGLRQGTALRRAEFEAALAALIGRGDVAQNGRQVRRNEPDYPEALLEDAVAPLLQGREVLSQLSADPERTVFHVSARGGTLNSGQFSRPDFTLATIRTRKYDPLRYLDVVTFELKNVAGTSLLAVHETLAHTRFAHYSYLICPRPSLRPERLEVIQNACAEHGVGLASFVIEGHGPEPSIGSFAFLLHPRRKTPDPDVVEKYLDDRFPPEKLEKLQAAARDL